MKGRLATWLLALLSLAAVLVLAEASLRLISQAGGGSTAHSVPREGGWIRDEQRTGWVPREGVTIQRQSPEGRAFALRINSTGQRGPELGPANPEQRRVLFLGDSFTMSSYLPREETFVARVGRGLAGAVAINGGVDGYGTYQQLAYYRYFGRLLAPDLVVLCFFIGNDWRDNMIATRQGSLLNPVLIPRPGRFWRHADPALRGADERLLGDPLTGQAVARPSADWALSLMRRSLLARLIGGRFERLRGRWQADLAALDLDHRYYFYEVGFYQGRDDGLFATARDLTLSCIRQLDRMVAADGAELAVVVLPSLYQVDRQEWLLMLERLSVAEADLGGLDMGHPNRLLAHFCRRENIPLLDMTDRFARAPDPSTFYLTAVGDGHFSARGHEFAAAAIGRYLAETDFRFRRPALGAYRRGQWHARRGEFAQAQAALQAASEREAGWGAAAVALGALYRDAGRRMQASAQYRRALAVDGRQAGWWAELARLLGAEQGAELAWQKALDLHPEQWLYSAGLADYFLAQGRPADAERIRRRVAATWEAPLPIRTYWWNEHISQGLQDIAASRWVEAERQFKWATRFLPSEPVGHYNLGMVYERTGQRGRALAAYRQALQAATDFTPARQKLQALGELH